MKTVAINGNIHGANKRGIKDVVSADGPAFLCLKFVFCMKSEELFVCPVYNNNSSHFFCIILPIKSHSKERELTQALICHTQ